MRIHRLIAILLLIISLVIPTFASAEEDVPYYITVDLANQIVTVYRNEDRTQSGIVRQMICSSGLHDATPTGTFTMPKRAYDEERGEWYYFEKYDIFAKYASRIRGSILFHSVLFKNRGDAEPTWGSVYSLGSPASHGCIRLPVADAKWIAENCLNGTEVEIFADAERDTQLRALLKYMTYSIEDMPYDAFYALRQNLLRGSKGEEVQALQQSLNYLGYDCGAADGSYGQQTEDAVAAYLADNDLEIEYGVSPELLTEIREKAGNSENQEVLYHALTNVNPVYGLNLRTTPSTEGSVILLLGNEVDVAVLSEEGEWTRIRYEGLTGYVKSKYLAKVD